MNLEPIVQSEVNQKEKYKHHILTHIHGIYKDDTDAFIFKAEVEKQHREQTCGHGGRGGGLDVWRE